MSVAAAWLSAPLPLASTRCDGAPPLASVRECHQRWPAVLSLAVSRCLRDHQPLSGSIQNRIYDRYFGYGWSDSMTLPLITTAQKGRMAGVNLDCDIRVAYRPRRTCQSKSRGQPRHEGLRRLSRQRARCHNRQPADEGSPAASLRLAGRCVGCGPPFPPLVIR